MFKYLLLLAALALFASCRQTTKITPWSNTKKMLSPPGFIAEIPLRKEGFRKGQPDLFYVFRQRYCRWYRLDSLAAGFDSIQIRVWLGCDLCKLKHVVIIENTGLHWDAKLVTLGPPLSFDEDGQYSIDLTGVTACAPLHGWDYFLNKMKELRITELPNGEDVDGFKGCGADGMLYLFEIATRYKYRFLNYGCAEDYADKIWQANNVLTFANLLEEEFGFTYER